MGDINEWKGTMRTQSFQNRSLLLVTCAACLLISGIAYSQSYTFTTLAGSSGYGTVDGQGTAARFMGPTGVAMDNSGNAYVADFMNHTIRKIAPAGVVTTIAGLAGVSGTADGIGCFARFNGPSALAVDAANNIFVTDSSNHTIRKISPTGTVTTFAGAAGAYGSTDGQGDVARFFFPYCIAVDSSNNLYVSDNNNFTVRKITSSAMVSTVAGSPGAQGTNDGVGSAALFGAPAGLAVDRAGNVYVSDWINYNIRKITAAGLVSTYAGAASVQGTNNGTGTAARFEAPVGLALDAATNLYVADYGAHTIRKITPARVVSTWAGMPLASGTLDGIGNAARFNGPNGVAVDLSSNVFVADNQNCAIRKITPTRGVTTFAGNPGGPASVDGTRSAARFNNPNNLALDAAGNVYVADEGGNTIRKITPQGVVSTIAGRAGVAGSTDGTGSAARFNHPESVAVDAHTNVYVADQWNHTIRKITPAGVVSTFAGRAGVAGIADGTGTAARFGDPSGVAVDPGSNLFVADYLHQTIRKITPAAVVTTFAGLADATGWQDGTGSNARFDCPYGVAVDTSSNVYVAEVYNCMIRKITPEGVVTKLAGVPNTQGSDDGDGSGSQARFNGPNAVAVDGAGNVYVADSGNYTIRKITPSGWVSTLAGGPGTYGYTDGTGSAAQFDWPYGIAVDAAANIYVADFGNNTIRKGVLTSSLGSVTLRSPRSSNNEFSFGLSGFESLLVKIQSSSDLRTWITVRSYCLNGGTNWVPALLQTSPRQFYRASIP